MPSPRLVVAFLLGLLFLVNPVAATWSILIVDLATGEVAIGIASCVVGLDLRPNAIVVVPGYGVAVAQAMIGPLSLRELIRTGLLNNQTASQILAALAAADPGHQTRQYGIASLTGGTISFTGTGTITFASGLTGQTGTLLYTVQGGALTGMPVLTAAQSAIVSTTGTIGDKLMAAMQAARAMGGDGRCSCSMTAPTSCGSPPPSFTNSSLIGLMILSRPSDLDTPCTSALGCAAGGYWMDFNIANQPANAPDPVIQLQTLYNAWKLQQVGRPDHFQSTVTMSASSLRANGVDSVTGTVVLRDAQGNPLGNTLPVTVGLRAGSTLTGITFGPVTPQPNGTYTFTMQGNLDAGEAILDVAVTDAFGRVGIWPQPAVNVLDVFGPCGRGAIPNGPSPYDALRINGTGGADRVATVGYGQPFTIALDPPVLAPPIPLPIGLFALWAHIGIPATALPVPLGGNSGSLCYTPAPFAPAPTLLLADSFGIGGLLTAPAAPWSVTIPGVPALLDFALQGVMIVDPAATFAATNAVLLRVVPLPPPTIVSVAPPSPTPSQITTVSGTNFLSGMQLAVAGNPVPFTQITPAQIQFVMPPGAPCDALLSVTNLGGLSAQRVFNATPVITSTPFTSGLAAGGSFYAVVGQNLTSATVTFNGVPMTITSNSATSITGTTPPGTVGQATVVVSNPNGCFASTTFTYL